MCGGGGGGGGWGLMFSGWWCGGDCLMVETCSAMCGSSMRLSLQDDSIVTEGYTMLCELGLNS